MKKIFFVLALVIAFSGYSQSKVGTINTDFIISQMPELTGVEQEIKSYGKELDQEIRSKYAEYQKLVEKFNEEEAELNDVMKQFKQNEIIDLEEDIQNLQQNSQQKLRSKQEELLRPLYTTIGNALEQVVEKHNYTQIFDEGNNLVYISPEYDVTIEVMKILDLPTEGFEAGEE
ncbi:MAG: OmpH family outer membrane protein [Bacteroidota bacterium]